MSRNSKNKIVSIDFLYGDEISNYFKRIFEHKVKCKINALIALLPNLPTAGYFFPIPPKNSTPYFSIYRPISGGRYRISVNERGISERNRRPPAIVLPVTRTITKRCLHLFAGQPVDATEAAPTLILIYG